MQDLPIHFIRFLSEQLAEAALKELERECEAGRLRDLVLAQSWCALAEQDRPGAAFLAEAPEWLWACALALERAGWRG